MLSKPQAMPKPRVYKTSRRQREEARLGEAFRRAVWLRDGLPTGIWAGSCGVCRYCGRWVYRTALAPNDDHFGHIHHLRGRNVAPEDRYNPDAAVLLCAVCHRAVHDGRIELSVDSQQK